MDARFHTAFLGIAASLAIGVLAWQSFDTLFVFPLLIPFVPFLFRERSRPQQRCPGVGSRRVRRSSNIVRATALDRRDHGTTSRNPTSSTTVRTTCIAVETSIPSVV